jgi:hypothetical protein
VKVIWLLHKDFGLLAQAAGAGLLVGICDSGQLSDGEGHQRYGRQASRWVAGVSKAVELDECDIRRRRNKRKSRRRRRRRRRNKRKSRRRRRRRRRRDNFPKRRSPVTAIGQKKNLLQLFTAG